MIGVSSLLTLWIVLKVLVTHPTFIHFDEECNNRFKPYIEEQNRVLKP
jgi:hypothetical protein